MSRRRGPSTSLRQLVALLVTFAVGVALVLATALLAPDVLRIDDYRGAGTSAASAAGTEVLVQAAVRGGSGSASTEGSDSGSSPQESAGVAADDEPESKQPADEADEPATKEPADEPDDPATKEPADEPDGSDAVDGGAARSPGASDGVAARVLALVNTERAAAGCSDLRADPALDDLALAHSRDMADRGFFDHTNPEGLSPWDRADAAGVPGVGAENLARGQPDAEAVVAAWMDSPGHRANILSCDLVRHGLGMQAGAGGPWWTQVFGR
ncbi:MULTISPECIES: CAP domain-containing protein [Isoptericola]|uniref:CAP domain-containing protein n=1 Tax=Isoptericola TaxID=254250 RepID=UPI001A9C99CE|nr:MULTISPECIES: CAP domain-containing protein [Isoptericola]